MASRREIEYVWAPGLRYAEAWALQRKLFEAVKRKQHNDVLILTEHPPVYTFGKTGKDAHLLLSPQKVEELGIDLHYIDRGGDITFHGPGQLVGYPIFDLHHFYLDVGRFLRELEEVLIRHAARYDLFCTREPGLTGVWAGDEKLAAIGIKLSRWVAMHGFALNVNTVLDYFTHIVPCGIHDKGVTSLSRLLGNEHSLEKIAHEIAAEFEAVFDVRMQQTTLARMRKKLIRLSDQSIGE